MEINLVHKVKRSADLEVHIRELVVDDVNLVDIREFIVPTTTYGRGIQFPREHLMDVIDGLDLVLEDG